MKEIIKHGKFYKKNMVITCPLCQCEFSYELDDIYKEKNTTLTIPTEQYFVFCPECNAEINIGQLITTIPSYPLPYYPYPQSLYGGPIVTYMDNNTKCSCNKGECSCTK